VGGKDLLRGPLAPLARLLARQAGRLPVPVPVLVAALPVQVREHDMGQALLRCVVAAGPPGAYNIAADGIVTGADIARELGLLPLPVPVGMVQSAARRISDLPFLPPVAQWVEAASHPAIMDTTRAKQELGWVPGSPRLRHCGILCGGNRGQTPLTHEPHWAAPEQRHPPALASLRFL
jgi:hypothetical protein